MFFADYLAISGGKSLRNASKTFIEGIDWPCLHRVTKLFAGCTHGLKVDGYFPFNLRSGPISHSHTFSLTATAKIGFCFCFALPAGMLLQSETKIEPDLRLFPIQNDCFTFDFL